MKVELGKNILNMISKEPLEMMISKKKEPVTGALIAAELLLSVYNDEPQLGAIDKVKRAKLAEKILDGNYDLELEEIVLIKDLCGRYSPPGIVHQMNELLEPKLKSV